MRLLLLNNESDGENVTLHSLLNKESDGGNVTLHYLLKKESDGGNVTLLLIVQGRGRQMPHESILQ